MISASDIRSRFLAYFTERGHTAVKSSPLVPYGDATLLFTNAGMVQFKDAFTGKEKRPYTRATTSQKCVRAGGKHNDLENVGVTARHHTFFEMLGNFSFGDYFKKDAITFAWDFITKEMKIDPAKLVVTVFKGEEKIPADEEAAKLWHELCGIPEERIIRLGAKDNFWAMGDTGPCGPCSELHVYQGEGPATVASFLENAETDGDLWIEIWNLVFMQFERFADGRYEPLPKPSIDTGMGLERIAAVANGFKSNYDTDLLLPLIQHAAELCNKKYTHSDGPDDVSLRVLADHARASAFLLADGVFPSNEGRGYVLRRIMRRAIRHGERLGFDDVFFFKITHKVIAVMGEAYPELRESESAIEKWVRNEEEGFRRTLRTGLRLLAQRTERLKLSAGKELAGADAFELYDTYGFPLDLTEVIVREQGLSVDHAGFEKALAEQRAKGGAFKNANTATADVYKEVAMAVGATTFLGYDLSEEHTDSTWRMTAVPGSDAAKIYDDGYVKCTVKALLQNGKRVTEAVGECEVVLEPTPFYGESGGQSGDHDGVFLTAARTPLAIVKDTHKPVDNLTVSEVTASAPLSEGMTVLAAYDAHTRHETRAHHSATHLLHKALRDTLGDHVKQAGSLVQANRLRFDYSHFEAATPAQLDTIEAHVNQRVRDGGTVTTDVLSFDDAKKRGAVALFGEKYGDRVRVLSIADSQELCGGTHARSLADVGELRVVREEAVAAGVRRIEAVAGDAAKALDRERRATLQEFADALAGKEVHNKDAQRVAKAVVSGGAAAQTVSIADISDDGLRSVTRTVLQLVNAKAPQRAELAAGAPTALTSALVTVLNHADEAAKKQNASRDQAAGESAKTIAAGARTVAGVQLVTHVLEGVESKSLRDYADKVRDALGSGVVALGLIDGGKAHLIIAVSKDLTARIQAGTLVKKLAPRIGGSGGGKPELAQAGGPDTAALAATLAAVADTIEAG